VLYEIASRLLVGFGILNENTIKELTCLHEIMSRNSIWELILNEMGHVLQTSVYIPLTLSSVTRKLRKENLEQGHG